jgi:hypothetical protein
MIMIVRLLSLFFALLSMLACAPARVDMSDPVFYNEKTPSIVMVKKVDYDSHGRPLFRDLLRERPLKSGEQFTLVYYCDNKPVKSFDIAIIGRKPDMLKPLAVIYDWTGSGFKVGAQLAAESLRGVGNDKYAWVVPAASLVVGTAAGFVIGIGASIPVALQEVGTLMADNEALLGFSEYAYDERGRIRSMRIFQPDEMQRELVKTEFNYRGDDTAPFETSVYSRPEDKIRTIR